MFCPVYLVTAARIKINEEFKKNKHISSPRSIEEVRFNVFKLLYVLVLKFYFPEHCRTHTKKKDVKF